MCIDLRHPVPEGAPSEDVRTTPDAQLRLTSTTERGRRVLHLESGAYGQPALRTIKLREGRGVDEAALQAVADAIGTLEPVRTGSPARPQASSSHAALPGPRAATGLPPSQATLIGVARWPDLPHGMETSARNKAYGRRFHETTLDASQRIADGQIQNFRQLWNFVGAARYQWVLDDPDRSGGPGKARQNQEQAFASGYPRQQDVTTPLGGRYGYVIERARTLQTTAIANGLAQQSGLALPPHFMAHHAFQMQGMLDGRPVALTTIRVAVNPEDFLHPVAKQLSEARGSGLRNTLSLPHSIEHTHFAAIPSIVNHVEHLYGSLMERPRTREELLPRLGELHWWMAHAMPDGRGSAAKTEMGMRAIALAHGIALPPFRRGIVPDLEAFMQDMETFSQGYADMLEPPAYRQPMR